MSVVMPYLPAQAEAWERRGPEPFDLDLSGWTRQVWAGRADRLLPNERLIELSSGEAVIHAIRWWDGPLRPGGPMRIASTRRVTIAGRDFEVHTTSVFEGAPAVREVVFLRGEGWRGRIVFKECEPGVIERVLADVAGYAGVSPA